MKKKRKISQKDNRVLLHDKLSHFRKFEEYISHRDLICILNQYNIEFKIVNGGNEKLFNYLHNHKNQQNFYFNTDNLYLFKNEVFIKNESKDRNSVPFKNYFDINDLNLYQDNKFIQIENHYIQINNEYNVDELKDFILKEIEGVDKIEPSINILAFSVLSFFTLGFPLFLILAIIKLTEVKVITGLVVLLISTFILLLITLNIGNKMEVKKKEENLNKYKDYKFIVIEEYVYLMTEEGIVSAHSFKGHDFNTLIIENMQNHMQYKEMKAHKEI